MAGLRPFRRPAAPFRVSAIAAAALLFSACMPNLGLISDLSDRVARANFEYGTKTVTSGTRYLASLGVNGDTLYVLYYDSVARKLYIIKSPDKGKTWNAPFVVDNTTDSYTRSNNLAVDGGAIYVSYQRSDHVYFVELTDTGPSFTASNFQVVGAALTYPYGYDNSVTYDASNVYLLYCSAGAPAFAYAAKAASMTFPTPVYFDSALTDPNNSGNSKRLSTYVDPDGYVNVAYFDDHNSYLKLAHFLPTDSLPYAVPNISYLPGPAYVTAADDPSIASSWGNLRLISYYDKGAKSLNFLEKFSYGKPPLLMLYFTNVMRVVDASSADVGRNTRALFVNNLVHVAYYDYANKQVKYARGVKIPWNPSPDTPPYYSFSTRVIDTVGGKDFDCSLACSADGQTLYILYYDSSNGGALKLAKSIDGGVSW